MATERRVGLRPVLARLSLAAALLGGLPGCAHAPVATGTAATGNARAQSEIISTITGDSPNFAQLANGSLMTVVSRDFGRGAKAGALVEFYYPHCATDQLWDSYIGVATGGTLRWAHQLRLVGQSIADDTGRVTSDFEGPGYTLKIEDVVSPTSNVHLRHVTLHNEGTQPLQNVSLVDYGYFMLNSLPTGDRVRYDASAHALLQSDTGVGVAVTADPAPTDARCGLANVPLGAAEDARCAAEQLAWKGPQAAGPSMGGVNATLRNAVGTLAPGQSASVTYALGAGPDTQSALDTARAGLESGWSGVTAADAQHWQAWLARARMPQGLSADALAVYRRALVTLGQHHVDDGAFIAAPTNLNPPYRFVWPRDGSLIALTLLNAGYVDEAKNFFAFCERLQQPSGGFAVNYFPDGSRPLWDFGPNGNEHDEVATFAWGVAQVYARTGDRAWLEARWPAVKRACAFLLAQQQPDGLLSTCRDLWELNDDGTWTYSNAAAWAGLSASAAIATQLGDDADAGLYHAAAVRLHDAMAKELAPAGYFVRGIRHGQVDPTLEAANLALGRYGFNAWADDDPLLLKTGQLVEQRLSSPGGGVRRYENDQYYDGQPWPVATAWLGLHKLALGDRPGATRLFDVMTRYADTTGARMLGEQFNEQQHRWVSAFPLAWSEAAYIQFALALDSGH